MTELPGPDIKPARRSLMERMSVVWLVPIGALLISLAIAWQNYASRGPLIEISFEDAEGIRTGETELRYRDVPVGVVEDVSFADGLGSVVVGVRLEQEIAPYVDAESEFWVIRPQVTAQGVSGLSTVLSGVYIQGSWDNVPGGTGERFEGLASAPVARPDVPGLRIVLTSESGDGLLQGTPILYRGVQVGAVSTLHLADTGQAVLADAFIEAPYDDLITSATRFWNASGFSFSLGPQGATLDVSSLAALVSGGVSLENLVSGGDPVDPGTTFELFDGRQEALSSVFIDPDTTNRVSVGFVFSGNVSGLAVGSAVEFRGRVGEIVAVTGYIDENSEDRRVQLLATAELDPTRLGLPSNATAEEALAFLDELAQRGVRAQVERGSILIGGLKVVLSEVDDVPQEGLKTGGEPVPIFPSTAAELPEGGDSVEALVAQANEVLDRVPALLQNVTDLVGSDAIQQIPEDVTAILGDVRGSVADIRAVLADFREEGAAAALTQALTQAAPTLDTLNQLLASAEPAVAELPALLTRLGDAAEDVAAITDTVANLPLDDLVTSAAGTAQAAEAFLASEGIQQVPREVTGVLSQLSATLDDVRSAGLVSTATTALSSAGEAAAQVAAATDQVPQLIERLSAAAADVATLAETASELPLSDLATSAAEAAEAARALVASDEIQQVPQDISAVLAQLSATLEDIREAGLVAEATGAVESAGAAAAQVAAATEDLPQLIARVEDVAATVAALPLTSAIESAESTLAAANTLLESEGVRALPAELNTALAELRLVLADFRQSGLVAQVNDTLAEASATAAAIREATAGVPGVVSGIDALTETVNSLPLDRLATDLAGLATAGEALLSAEGAQDLPSSLNATLAELQTALEELRRGGLIDSANQTLASARDAAAAVEQASESLPTLANRLDSLADQAEQTLAGYDEGSELTREAQATLREVQAAARAVSALARQIERNPNSLLLGR